MPGDIIIYTDGGCWPNPGVGGWGVVITYPDGRREELAGGEKTSTNNRMELMGPIIALDRQPRGAAISLYSDSRYVIDGITDWIINWRQSGWRTQAGKAVKNRELWERLDAARACRTVRFVWVKGHAGILDNERADQLSQVGAVDANGGPLDFEAIIAQQQRWKRAARGGRRRFQRWRSAS